MTSFQRLPSLRGADAALLEGYPRCVTLWWSYSFDAERSHVIKFTPASVALDIYAIPASGSAQKDGAFAIRAVLKAVLPVVFSFDPFSHKPGFRLDHFPLDVSRIKVYKPLMPKWVAKISWSQGQCRVTIPKGLVEKMGWQDASVLEMWPHHLDSIVVGRFKDGESPKFKKPTD